MIVMIMMTDYDDGNNSVCQNSSFKTVQSVKISVVMLSLSQCFIVVLPFVYIN